MPRPIPLIFHIFLTEKGQRVWTVDTHSEKGGPERLPAQVAGRWGHINLNSVQWGKFFILGWPEQPRFNKSILHRHDEPHEPSKEGTLSIVIFDSSFTSVSTVSRVHPSLISLVWTIEKEEYREKTEIVHRSTYRVSLTLQCYIWLAIVGGGGGGIF